MDIPPASEWSSSLAFSAVSWCAHGEKVIWPCGKLIKTNWNNMFFWCICTHIYIQTLIHTRTDTHTYTCIYIYKHKWIYAYMKYIFLHTIHEHLFWKSPNPVANQLFCEMQLRFPHHTRLLPLSTSLGHPVSSLLVVLNMFQVILKQICSIPFFPKSSAYVWLCLGVWTSQCCILKLGVGEPWGFLRISWDQCLIFIHMKPMKKDLMPSWHCVERVPGHGEPDA